MADKPKPRLIYHYCDLDALKAIVESQRFRLSNVFFVNDYLEIDWFKSVSLSVLNELRKSITDRDPPTPPGTLSGPSELSIAGSYFCDRLENWLKNKVFDHVYCGCFSAIVDDLSQWRGYADEARGVCIGADLRDPLPEN